jgi:predicted transcriptional regulator
MIIKKVKIDIRSPKKVLKDFAETAKALEKGKRVKSSRGFYFENLAAFKKAFTEKRMEMLHVIKEEKPSSIYALTKMLHRNIKNVNDDIGHLENIGLVVLKRKKDKRRRVIPKVTYDRINLEITI